MLKEALKNNWGNYCDTDKLVNDVMELLTKYHHKNTEHGVCEMLDVYFRNKRELIDMFAKSEHYIGDMRICLDVELERRNDTNELREFLQRFSDSVEASKAILKFEDEDGKKLEDYIRVGFSRFTARNFHYGDIAERLISNKEKANRFRGDGSTQESFLDFDRFNNIVWRFRDNPEATLSGYMQDVLTQFKINATFTVGMKTSRAFNRMCTYYGVDKLPNYNKLFAQYADMVSGLKRKVKFYLSLNPLDYLTMSFGNSWSSCHTIDKRNERNMPSSYSGMYCGGTMSYMLDQTSFITFVHKNKMTHYEDGKIYRNMFHFSNGKLIQGRIYPQGNDGAMDLYREFRAIVQAEMAKLLGLENNNWVKKNGSCDESTRTTGPHYPDYLNFEECNVTYPREMPEASGRIVNIGHQRICPNCGCEIDRCVESGWLTHPDCEYTPDDERNV
jgi:hypothetical protein